VGEVFRMTLEYRVLREFEAIEAISQRTKRLERGTVITYDTDQTGPTVIVEADMTLFLIDRSTFKACCEFKNEPGSAYGD
jgi:hypothetical protein